MDLNATMLRQLALAALVPSLLSIIIASVYMRVRERSKVKTDFVQALCLLAVVASLVTLLIGDSLARAFGLLGALSIVRFRNTLKSPVDVAYVLTALVVGIGCGSEHWGIASVLALVVPGLHAALAFVGFGVMPETEKKGLQEVSSAGAAPAGD